MNIKNKYKSLVIKVMFLGLFLPFNPNQLKIENIKYVDITLKCQNIKNKKLVKAYIYGYSPLYGLLWPRILHEQYFQIWSDIPKKQTSLYGKWVITIPKGVWSFTTYKAIPDHEKKSLTIIYASSIAHTIKNNKKIILAPKYRTKVIFNQAKSYQISTILCRDNAIGIWFFVPVSLKSSISSFNLHHNLDTDMAIIANDIKNQADYFIQFKVPVRNKKYIIDMNKSNFAKVIFKVKNNYLKPNILSWNKNIPGYNLKLKIKKNKTIYFSPGNYYINYNCINQSGQLIQFGTKEFQLNAKSEYIFHIGDNYSTGINKYTPITYQINPVNPNSIKPKIRASLCIADNQGLIAWYNNNDNWIPFPQGGKIETYPISLRKNVLNNNLKNSFNHNWYIQNPLSSIIGSDFITSKSILIKSDTLYTTIAEPYQYIMRDFILSTEKLNTTIQMICGYTKKKITKINMIPNSAFYGQHDGSWLSAKLEILSLPVPIQHHGFVHELTHNFNYFHDPLMELVVELSRCPKKIQITAQLAKWMFFDKMNNKTTKGNIPRRWKDYKRDSPLGLYFFLYNISGPDFIKNLTNYTWKTRRSLSKNISKHTARVVLTSLASKNNTKHLWEKYGYKINNEQYIKAKKEISSVLNRKKTIIIHNNYRYRLISEKQNIKNILFNNIITTNLIESNKTNTYQIFLYNTQNKIFSLEGEIYLSQYPSLTGKGGVDIYIRERDSYHRYGVYGKGLRVKRSLLAGKMVSLFKYPIKFSNIKLYTWLPLKIYAGFNKMIITIGTETGTVTGHFNQKGINYISVYNHGKVRNLKLRILK